MREFRLSVSGMLAAIAVLGVWIASIRTASALWLSVIATATLTVLLYSVLSAYYGRGPTRAFWCGFALFGWVYLVLVSWDWIGGPLGHDLTGGLREVAERLFPPDPTLAAARTVMSGGNLRTAPFRALPPGFDYYEVNQQREVRIGNFVQIGRMTLSLLFALLGGVITRSVAGRGTGGGPPAASG